MKLRTLLSTLTLALAAAAASAAPAGQPVKGDFRAGDKTFLLNGKPFTVRAAELHYPRIPRQYWDHRIKMCKALGMNAVCLYVFWNIHEPQEGQFDFTGQNDVAAFCRLVQKNGMYVIVRPGPYVCAEWEMGGLPWWLLKKKDIRLREQDPYFMERVEKFETEIGRQLAPLTIQNGGPIIMVQVENEYGSYGKDKPYVSAIRDIIRRTGFDKVALFQCDWASNFDQNGLDDLTWTMNFGTGANIDSQFERLGQMRPGSPRMCSEYWSGWFDKWGAAHETRPAEAMTAGIDEMLSKGISFSLYMTHGGTSFGHWAGANSPGYSPDVTSYDYDAPINEQGAPTDKYFKLRKTMQKYAEGKLPAVPKALPVMSVPEFKLTEFVPLTCGITKETKSVRPLTMEETDMGWGTLVYSTRLPALAAGATLTINEAHDFAQVFIGDTYVGKISRPHAEKTLTLPAARQGQELRIIVEGMGRINYGRAIKDYKGIVGDVTIAAEQLGHQVTYNLKNWNIANIPDDYANATRALGMVYQGNIAMPRALDCGIKNCRRGYYRGWFATKKTADTYLSLEAFGKGQVWVNGHAIGRFWHIGPQQTLYVPGCWLKKGKNEVVVLDIVGPEGEPVCFGQTTPELDKLHLDKPMLSRLPGETITMEGRTPVAEGQFKPGNGWQTVKLAKPTSGRYLAIECLDAQDKGQKAAIAEVEVIGTKGERLSRETWSARYADSEDIKAGNNTAPKVFDHQESTYWQTEDGSPYPHLLIVNLGDSHTLTAVELLPRAEQGAPGSVRQYKIYLYE